MNQNEINRVAGARSIWGDLSLRLVIARLAGTTHSHFSRLHGASIPGTWGSMGLAEKQRPGPFQNFSSLGPGRISRHPAFLG